MAKIPIDTGSTEKLSDAVKNQLTDSMAEDASAKVSDGISWLPDIKFGKPSKKPPNSENPLK